MPARFTCRTFSTNSLPFGTQGTDRRRHQYIVRPPVSLRLAPGFGRDALAELVRENAGTAAMMLVGHEPDFSRTIAACIGGGRVEIGKGALARVLLEETPSLKGTLVWLAPPSLLAR